MKLLLQFILIAVTLNRQIGHCGSKKATNLKEIILSLLLVFISIVFKAYQYFLFDTFGVPLRRHNTAPKQEN